MKKLFKAIAGTIAILGMVYLVSAFTIKKYDPSEPNETLQEGWFVYTIGHPTSLEQAREPSNYTQGTPSCLEGQEVLCAIKAMTTLDDENNVIPDISGSVDAALATYFSSGAVDPDYIELKAN